MHYFIAARQIRETAPFSGWERLLDYIVRGWGRMHLWLCHAEKVHGLIKKDTGRTDFVFPSFDVLYATYGSSRGCERVVGWQWHGQLGLREINASGKWNAGHIAQQPATRDEPRTGPLLPLPAAHYVL